MFVCVWVLLWVCLFFQMFRAVLRPWQISPTRYVCLLHPLASWPHPLVLEYLHHMCMITFLCVSRSLCACFLQSERSKGVILSSTHASHMSFTFICLSHAICMLSCVVHMFFTCSSHAFTCLSHSKRPIHAIIHFFMTCTFDMPVSLSTVATYPFDDHNAPPFELIRPFCDDMDLWLKEDDRNIAVVHCKAGKVSSLVCMYIMWQSHDSAKEIMS